MWKLIALTEPLVGKEFIIVTDTVLGRHHQSHIVLPSARISRRHAVLRMLNGELWLEDLSSALGSFVNGQRVDEQQLMDQDELVFDGIRFRVQCIPLADAQVASQSDTQDHGIQDIEVNISVDQGMPTLAERDAGVQIQTDGMPISIGIPKPAPIPDTININDSHAVDAAAPILDQPLTAIVEQQKNVKLGLIAVLLVLLIIVLVLFVLSK